MVKMAIFKAEMKGRVKGGKSKLLRPRRKTHGHNEGLRCIVKRRGSDVCEGYDERKVYGSTYAACYVVLMNEKECERIADSVAKNVTKHVHKKKEIGSKEIARLVSKELKKRNPHAAFMYETHTDLA